MLTSLVLTAALSGSSGGLLAGYVSPHVRLIDVPTEAGGFVARVSKHAAQGLEQMTPDQLMLERDRLSDERPGLALPIVLMIAGAVTAAVGYGVVFGATIAGVIIFSVGAAALIVGTVILIANIVKRGKLTRDITYIDGLIRTRTMGAPPGQPMPPGQPYTPPSDVPPPPPPQQPGVFAPVAAPQLLLATF